MRAGNIIGHRLEAAESIRPFLEAIFCLHDRRLVPYYKYLQWELETWPLSKLEIPTEELVQSLTLILETGDWQLQQQLLREAERAFTLEGYGAYFEWNMPKTCLDFAL